MKLRFNKYSIKIIIIIIALILLGVIFNLGNMTDVKYDARKSILTLLSHNSSYKLIENESKSLNKFYTELISDVSEWKIPRDYTLTEANIITSTDTFNLLELYNNESIDIKLKGNVKFILKLLNNNLKTTAESIMNIKLNEVNIWEINNEINVNIEERKYFYISLILSGIFLIFLLLIRRSKIIFLIFFFLFFFLSIIASKLFFIQFDNISLYKKYIGKLSSICILIVLILYYFYQAKELGKYNEMHLLFSYQFKTLITLISILLSIFNHNIIVNIINWFIWVPILQCYIFQNYQQIINKNFKEDIKLEEFDVLKIETESIQEYSDFHQRRKKNFRPYLMFIYLILFLISLIVCFKNINYFNSTNEINNAMSNSFHVDMNVFNIEDFNNQNSIITFKIIKNNKKVIIDDISLITTIEVLNKWIESFLKNVTFKNSLILFKDLETSSEYKLLNEDNTKDLSKINIKLLFIFENIDQITTAEVSRYGVRSTGSSTLIKIGKKTTLKNLRIITFGLKQNKYLGILIFFNCIILLAALIFTGGKDKSKLKASIIIFLFIINFSFGVFFFFIIPKLLYIINLNINIMKGALEGEILNKFILSILKFIFIRKVVTVIIFICLVLTIVYIIISLPKEYSTFNENMTSIKRTINLDYKNLRILFYQFILLLIISSIIGHESFGYKYDEFKNELLSLRYNLIMIFNKFLIEPKPEIKSLLYIYHRVGIFVFYNVVFTSLIATFYFYSCTNRQLFNKHFFIFPKPTDFNFDVKIKATFDEILIFKVFLESFNAYKDYKSNNDDWCNKFVEIFNQKKYGINKLTFNGDLYVYFERIKRYILCIIFLRIKINSFTEKINDLEHEKELIKLKNENKKYYLILLKKKLFDTTNEIENFKSKYNILQLIQSNESSGSNQINGSNVLTGVNKGVTEVNGSNGSIVDEKELVKKYNTKELEDFLIIPILNTIDSVSSVEQVENEVDNVEQVGNEVESIQVDVEQVVNLVDTVVNEDTEVDTVVNEDIESLIQNEELNEQCSQNIINNNINVKNEENEENVEKEEKNEENNEENSSLREQKEDKELKMRLGRIKSIEELEIGIFKSNILKNSKKF
ncbi:integral membrane protein, putative [Theileria annulata]|uniref:Integral membrane protein, putative n=1 Tax=Theileria annulata TaxID=5874 RepID=Q4UAW5_THEAN|nr:integral membrane protein, putative [Theileria annulata]CAI76036.1 integral membrane protein, putative [Theileria annulata]|eukprot:XP_955512.1 integral membrane protein, putative [Theileria annulata]